MLQNAYFLAKIGADTAENEQHFAEILPIDRAGLQGRPCSAGSRGLSALQTAPETETLGTLSGPVGGAGRDHQLPDDFFGPPRPPEPAAGPCGLVSRLRCEHIFFEIC